MMEKKNLKVISLALSIINLAVLFVLNYGKVGFAGLSEGISFNNATSASGLLWLLVFIPVMLIAIPYAGDAIKKYENILNLVLPIVGLALHVLLYFYIKGRLDMLGLSSYGVEISAGLGFYAVLLTYIALVIVNIMGAKNVDFGNAKINDIVNKAADTATSTTDKVLKTVDQTVDTIKNREDKE